MTPRLKQPLFSKANKAQAKAKINHDLYLLTRAYDQIWNFRYNPIDMTRIDLLNNAEANLRMFYDTLKHELGTDAFEEQPKQLSFDETILGLRNQNQATKPKGDTQ